jgi:RNA polymerase sigma-70 factor, ECF subfamily
MGSLQFPHASHPQDAADSGERELIAGIRAGNAEAFATVFHTYWRTLCGFADRCLDSRDAAQDIVQSVFVQMWTKRETLHVAGSLKSYLFAAVRNGVLNHARHAAVEHRLELLPADSVPGMSERAASSDVQMEHDEQVASLRTALTCLPPRMRLIATMRWYQRLSHAEIAEVLGISPATVNNQLTSALRVLRERLRNTP